MFPSNECYFEVVSVLVCKSRVILGFSLSSDSGVVLLVNYKYHRYLSINQDEIIETLHKVRIEHTWTSDNSEVGPGAMDE